MNNDPVGVVVMAALFGAVCGLLLVGVIALTLRLDRSRHAKVQRAREARYPSSE